jgi:hypothetical protein
MKAIIAYFVGVLAIAIFLSQILMAFTGVLAMVNFGSKIHGWVGKKFAATRQAA